MNIRMFSITLLACCLWLGSVIAARGAEELRNDQIRAQFDDRGLTGIENPATKLKIIFSGDAFSLGVNDRIIESRNLKSQASAKKSDTLTYSYSDGAYTVDVVYELKPGWSFVSKQLKLRHAGAAEDRITTVTVFQAALQNALQGPPPAAPGRGAAPRRRPAVEFVRFADTVPRAGQAAGGAGAFFALQNPFLMLQRQDKQISLAYSANMPWKTEWGPFESDRVCIGPTTLTGVDYARGLVREWPYYPEPGQTVQSAAKIDIGEWQAMRDCVNAFVQWHPRESSRVVIGWCMNDYQIDVGTPEGAAEYKRIVDRAAEVGAKDILFTPANYELATLRENRDAWGWENVLWLNMGQKIRKGEWAPGRDPTPAGLQALIDYAHSKKLNYMAYVYPSMAFMQNPEWTAYLTNNGKRPQGYAEVDTGIRSFQDWLVKTILDFSRQTGIAGVSFDHWWIAYTDKDASSLYAQWYGCRRILELLRAAKPDFLIDGRQQYHQFGVWTWVPGSWPHPLNTDEQPGSFRAFPDLHFDRVSADRQRMYAYWYAVEQYTPVDILPGYMTHQTMRSAATGGTVRDRAFRTRDWDYLGWKYSVLSSIGTAPVNHVINYLPARDPDEFKAFSAEDKAWFRQWLDFTDKNKAILKKLRPIPELSPPMVGRVDGTAAIDGDHGFIFLFNPNYRALDAEFKLDQSIGVTKSQAFLIREIYPNAGMLIGIPQFFSVWSAGDRVKVAMEGTSVRVLELVAKPTGNLNEALLIGAPGKVSLVADEVHLSGVRGPVGEKVAMRVGPLLDCKINRVLVNGVPVTFTVIPIPAKESYLFIELEAVFAGQPFCQAQQIGKYDPTFNGTTFTSTFTIPARIKKQLEDRKKAWPIPYTEDDLLATWLAPWRQLVFINIADPQPTMQVAMKIDGQPVEVKKAFSDVYGRGATNCFTGFYADLSAVEPDKQHTIEVTLPEGLAPGRFQGVFFDNVETEYTDQLAK